MTLINVLFVLFVLGAINIVRIRVRHNGLIAGIVFSIIPVFFFSVLFLILLLVGAVIKEGAYNYSDEGEKVQESWRQEQISLTGADPCEVLYARERERRHTQELAASGALSDGEVMVDAMTNDPYAGMTWEERDAALAHDHELSKKCPPLDYLESLQ